MPQSRAVVSVGPQALRISIRHGPIMFHSIIIIIIISIIIIIIIIECILGFHIII